MDIEYIYPTGTERLDRLAERPCADGVCGTQAFSFKDIFDVVNPLQQLPIVGSLYRQATGDTISTGARLAGGFLLGGPIGFMVAAFNAGLEGATGADVGEHMLAALDKNPNQQYAMQAYKQAGQLG